MVLTFKHYLIIAVVLLFLATGGLTYKLIGEIQKNKGFQEAFELFEKKAEKDKLDIKKQSDSIAEAVHWILQDIASLNNSLGKIEGDIDVINSRSNDKKDHIRNIRDVDSLQKLVSKRYN